MDQAADCIISALNDTTQLLTGLLFVDPQQ